MPADEPTPDHPTQGDIQQRIDAALLQLVDLGTALLAAVTAKVAAGADLAELVPHYDTIGRGIRKTALLVRHLSRPAPAAAAPKAEPKPDRVGARKRILREVEDAIHAKARGPAADDLRAELAERLDSPDLEHDIEARPIPDIVRDICRDLGVLGMNGQFLRRTPQDIQDLCTRAAAPQDGPSAQPWAAQPSAAQPSAAPPRAASRPQPEFEPYFEPDEFEPSPRPTVAPGAAGSLLDYLTRSRGT